MSRYTIRPDGPFDLGRSILFLESWPVTHRLPDADSVLRFGFCVEHDWRPVGVRVAQRGADVDIETSGPGADADGVAGQVARILSIDIDATVIGEVAQRDPVVAGLVAAEPGKRPVCFWTPWEAACWAVLSQRTSMRTASAIKQHISEDYGTSVDVDGQRIATFPAPAVLLGAPSLRGVNPVKLERMKGLAAAALDGTLTAATLRALPGDDALARLRELPGVGPFSAGLILIRGAGAPDVFTTSEARLLAAMRTVYHLPGTVGDDDYHAIAGNWRPLRSWVSFWLRSASELATQTLAAAVAR